MDTLDSLSWLVCSQRKMFLVFLAIKTIFFFNMIDMYVPTKHISQKKIKGLSEGIFARFYSSLYLFRNDAIYMKK